MIPSRRISNKHNSNVLSKTESEVPECSNIGVFEVFEPHCKIQRKELLTSSLIAMYVICVCKPFKKTSKMIDPHAYTLNN